MENEPSRVVDALPGLVWTPLPEEQIDFLWIASVRAAQAVLQGGATPAHRWCGTNPGRKISRSRTVCEPAFDVADQQRSRK
jgi:hypothetical protein